MKDMIQGAPCAYYYSFRATFKSYSELGNDFTVVLDSGRELRFDPYVGCATRRKPDQLLGKTFFIKDAWQGPDFVWLTNTTFRAAK